MSLLVINPPAAASRRSAPLPGYRTRREKLHVLPIVRDEFRRLFLERGGRHIMALTPTKTALRRTPTVLFQERSRNGSFDLQTLARLYARMSGATIERLFYTGVAPG